MAGLCVGGNEPPGSLKARNPFETYLSFSEFCRPWPGPNGEDDMLILVCAVQNKKHEADENAKRAHTVRGRNEGQGYLAVGRQHPCGTRVDSAVAFLRSISTQPHAS
ncbi:hypothetical protein ANN_02770 [Periplaneta americana]|uniref:Uncharacterized protein n=1 Tax=Periplaneta americana TaxID=6978 RepID=A0ABQ8U0R9_PERAM|nr:hypothetical protein ANN_02770 [Periplaneta americana]